MSQESVNVVMGALDAYNRRDLTVYDELYTPGYESFPALIGAVDGASFVGREGVARYYEVVGDTWRTSVSRARSSATSTTVSSLASAWRGAARAAACPWSGAKRWELVEFREGLILRWVQFNEPPPGCDEATSITLSLARDTGS